MMSDVRLNDDARIEVNLHQRSPRPSLMIVRESGAIPSAVNSMETLLKTIPNILHRPCGFSNEKLHRRALKTCATRYLWRRSARAFDGLCENALQCAVGIHPIGHETTPTPFCR